MSRFLPDRTTSGAALSGLLLALAFPSAALESRAWFGRSSAPYQHLAMTRFRAIENRIWVARVANTGISAFITPSGRVQGETAVFKETVTVARAGLGAENSLYTRFGDVFPGLFLAISILWLVRSRRSYGAGCQEGPVVDNNRSRCHGGGAFRTT